MCYLQPTPNKKVPEEKEKQVRPLDRSDNLLKWGYLNGSCVNGLQITRMCDHDCIHKVGRTQTTGHRAAKAVSSHEHISLGVDRALAGTNPTAPILS